MSNPTYPVPTEFAANTIVNTQQYREMYEHSINNPEEFWAEQANSYLTWFKPWDSTLEWDYNSANDGNVSINWFKGGKINASYNCLDRHLKERGEQTAIIWEGDNPNESRKISYRELHQEVSKFANVLKGRGVSKGDRVSIYMPMIPEAAVAMLACSRIGAIHSVLF